ncbi:MAG: hypothetical protein ACYSWQ_01350 [Planctomycetota bacterium]|jgi:hypothetical protein
MTEDIRTQYKAEEILASIPSDRGELFIGYRPAAEPHKWREQFHQRLERQPGRHLSRSVFEIPGSAEGSVVVEVAECASARDAVEDLMETLAENQAAALDPGPESLRPAAFQHPEQAPAGLFFARANLRISIMSQSKASDRVDEWLGVIQRDLDLAPGDARDSLEIRSGDTREDAARLNYKLPWKVGPEGWLKFISKGAPIERGEKTGELALGPSKAGVTVQGWVLERGRESYMGEFKSTGK